MLIRYRILSILLFISLSLLNLSAIGQAVNYFESLSLKHYYFNAFEIDSSEQTLQAIRKEETLKNTSLKLYLVSLTSTISSFIYLSDDSFELWEKKHEQLQDELKSQEEGIYYSFAKAELSAHAAMLHASRQEYLKTFFNLRQSFQLHKEIVEKHPEFLPSKKTLGALYVVLGSIPEKYHWFTRLFGIKGDSQKGMRYLEEVIYSQSIFSPEAQILKNYLLSTLLQSPKEAHQNFKEMIGNALEDFPQLFYLFAIQNAIRTNHAADALEFISEMEKKKDGIICYLSYFKGSAELLSGNFMKAVPLLEKYIRTSCNEHYIKDAYYRIFLAHWMEDAPQAFNYLDSVQQKGARLTVQDRYADKFAHSPLPNKQLQRARIYFDGGELQKSFDVLQNISSDQLNSQKDKVELLYRKARVNHELGNFQSALFLYQQTMQQGKDLPHYFSAMSSLQAGNIYLEYYKDSTVAIRYFENVLNFPEHEYSNSMEYSVKSCLERAGKQ